MSFLICRSVVLVVLQQDNILLICWSVAQIIKESKFCTSSWLYPKSSNTDLLGGSVKECCCFQSDIM